MRTCIDISLRNKMRTVILTIKDENEVRELKVKFTEKPFKDGDFKPSATRQICQEAIKQYYPGQAAQVEAFKTFRNDTKAAAKSLYSRPQDFRKSIVRLKALLALADTITPQGEEAYYFYRSVLMIVNSFASGVPSDTEPETRQARRDAYAAKKALKSA